MGEHIDTRSERNRKRRNNKRVDESNHYEDGGRRKKQTFKEYVSHQGRYEPDQGDDDAEMLRGIKIK